MKWFKHLTDAQRDEKLVGIRSTLGWEGYGYWWGLVEMVAEKLKNDTDEPSITLPAKHLAKMFGTYPNKLEKILKTFANVSLISLECFEEDNEKIFKCSIPKLLSLKQKDLGRKRITGVSSESTPPLDKDKDKEPLKSPKGESRIDLKFNSWYRIYPKKKAKDKAQRAFKKINPNDNTFNEMMFTLEWQVKSHDWIKEGGEYIPFPASYLNAGQWKDKPGNGVEIPKDYRFEYVPQF